MADADFDEVDGGYGAASPGRVQRLVNLAGAATSVALVVGLGVWGYQLAMRDVTGVPVVRALEGPMRVAPETPGGAVADYQGLSVNDIAAEGTAAPPPDRLVLAPRPVELTQEDGAGLSAVPPLEVVAAAPAAPLLPADPVALEPLPDAATEGEADAIDAAVALALADALAEGVAPLADLTEAAPEPAPAGAITRSPRPQARPDGAVSAAPATTAPAPSVEVDAATLEPGTPLIQLGAFDSAEQARSAWAELQTRFGAELTGKALVVQAAVSGGATFYRLRAQGFESEDDARRTCAAMLPGHDNCIPVAHR